MSKSFQFPTFRQMFPVEKRKAKLLREFLRYRFHLFLHAKQCHQLISFLQANPVWIPLFTQSMYRFNCLLSKFCDNRFNAKARLNAITDSLKLAEAHFSKQLCIKLLEQQSLPITQLTEQLQLKLNINQIDPYEGYFSLNIVDDQQRSIYDASFTFLRPNIMLIASIQGPNSAEAQSLVRDATKQLHGVRPMFMLVNAFKRLSQQLNCELWAIAHKNQAKYRWNDSAKLLFNYDEFWQENSGNLNSQGYWTLRQSLEIKPLEEIQSKKRSMYRKRYEMFAAMEQDIHQLFVQDN